jgi:hypothetical protein
MYTIENSITQSDRRFTFWRNVKTLTNGVKTFGLVTLKVNQVPTLNEGWSYSVIEMQGNLTLAVKAGQSIDKVVDNLGNVYYDITDLI